MTVTVVRLVAYTAQVVENPLKGLCQAVVFREGYEACKKLYRVIRGNWLLCEPHSRPDDVEVDFGGLTD